MLRRGLALDGWQEQSVPALAGAFWQCFAPWDSKGVPGSHGGFPGFHMAHFIQQLNHLWVPTNKDHSVLFTMSLLTADTLLTTDIARRV